MLPRRGWPHLSRRSRTAAAIVAIAAALWMIWIFGINAPHFDAPRPVAKAERGVGLRLAELKADEEIVVVRVPESGSPLELRFRPAASGATLILSQLAWENRAATRLVRVLEARDLSPDAALGVDAVLAFLRRQPRVPSRVQRVSLRIEHLRNGNVVGRETLEESPLLHEVTAVQRVPVPDAEMLRRLEDAARDAGLTLDEVQRWVTFELLLETQIER